MGDGEALAGGVVRPGEAVIVVELAPAQHLALERV